MMGFICFAFVMEMTSKWFVCCGSFAMWKISILKDLAEIVHDVLSEWEFNKAHEETFSELLWEFVDISNVLQNIDMNFYRKSFQKVTKQAHLVKHTPTESSKIAQFVNKTFDPLNKSLLHKLHVTLDWEEKALQQSKFPGEIKPHVLWTFWFLV